MTLTPCTVSFKYFSQSFRVTGRLDAEYYQKKYDILVSSLNNFHCKRLGDIVTITKSIEPGSEYYGTAGVPFIRVSDINKYGISTPDIKIPRHLSSLHPQKNTILLSKDGSVGIAYKCENDIDAITSGALLHLKINNSEIFPDYLTLILNSEITKMQAERDAGGSIIPHWKPSEIANVIIPILDNPTQLQLSAKIQQSFALRRQAEQLLNNAKRAVELAIEESEDYAMQWLLDQNS